MGAVDQDLVIKVNGEPEESRADNAPRAKRFIMVAALVLDQVQDRVMADQGVLRRENPLRGLENPEIRVKVSDLTRDFLIRV